jgi:hypothetical protein
MILAVPGQDDRQRQERHHEEPVSEPHQHVVGLPAEPVVQRPEVPGDDANDSADHHRQQRRGEADQQGDPRSPDQLGEHGATIGVSAERVVPAGPGIRRVGGEHRIEPARARQYRGGEGDDDHHDQDDQVDHPVAVLSV